MTYILRFSGKDAIGCWPANSSVLEKAIEEVKDVSELMKANTFLDELTEGKLVEIYSYQRAKSSSPEEEQLEFYLK